MTSPLFLLTRVDPVDDVLAKEAAGMGCRVTRLGLLATEPEGDLTRLSRELAMLDEGTALAWTSRRAAMALASAAIPRYKDALARVPLYAVGDESAAPIRQTGLTVSTPEEGRGAADLARLIAKRAAPGAVRRVIFLHGDRSLPDLPAGIKAAGIDVESIEVYRTRFLSVDVGELEIALRDGGPIVAGFFSPSGVEALERLLSAESKARLRERAVAIARGPTTHEELRSRGYRSTVQPDPSATFESSAKNALLTIARSRS